MFLEFTPASVTHSPEQESAGIELATLPARITWPLPGTWKLTTTIDPHGRARATEVAATRSSASAAVTAELAACLERAAQHVQVEAPDTGGAIIEWSVSARR